MVPGERVTSVAKKGHMRQDENSRLHRPVGPDLFIDGSQGKGTAPVTGRGKGIL